MDDQERQQLQDQYAEIARLAGGLAHEIRNPLSTISLNLELVVEDLEERADSRDGKTLARLAKLQQECENLNGLLNAFLQFARAGEPELVEVDLNDIVRDFVDFYEATAREKGIDVRPHLQSDLPAVRLDRALIRQVLMNLAQNAQQAMPDGGLLELQTFCRDGQVVLEFIDTGRGMDRATSAKIFQVFFSTRTGGSGLGLPTVRKIIEAHRGTIVCESEPGRGTRFSISLPTS